MKKLISAILLFTLLTSGYPQEKSDIDLFESAFSIKNLNTLNELVKKLDDFVLQRFPSNNSLDSSYRIFLTRECNPGNFEDTKSDSIFFSDLRKLYIDSKFENQIVLKVDTLTLIENNTKLVRHYAFYDNNEQSVVILDTLRLPPNPNNIDLSYSNLQTFNNSLQWQLRLFNVFGEYYRGLEKVKHRNESIASYVGNPPTNPYCP